MKKTIISSVCGCASLLLGDCLIFGATLSYGLRQTTSNDMSYAFSHIIPFIIGFVLALSMPVFDLVYHSLIKKDSPFVSLFVYLIISAIFIILESILFGIADSVWGQLLVSFIFAIVMFLFIGCSFIVRKKS